jgi:hypothetical protein
MSYFGCRAAPLGPVGPDLVAALFYSFHPAMVARALPDAWDYAAPAELIDARLQAVDSAVRRLFPGTSFGRKWFAALRNLTFRTLPYLPWRRLIDERPLKVGNAIELRTYEDQPQRPAAPRP